MSDKTEKHLKSIDNTLVAILKELKKTNKNRTVTVKTELVGDLKDAVAEMKKDDGSL